jgi:hypothetical protein
VKEIKGGFKEGDPHLKLSITPHNLEEGGKYVVGESPL